MKLRHLTLTNVRRFAGRTAAIGPFGDGLTTITAENESGKSTFFDALHHLIFTDHGSSRKDIRDMQPYSGGPIQIAAEIEIDDTPYRIEKTFALKKAGSSAIVTDLSTGTIIKQSDDAEKWIHDQIISTHQGPAGLLWVRQGTVTVDPEKSEAAGIDTRRDLMSSVRGQIDAVTGGRRMDAILQKCHSELDEISTKQGKPKAGSKWKDAEDRVQDSIQLHTELTEKVQHLSRDLELKERTKKRLKDLNDLQLRQERKDKITASLALLNAAQEHDRRLQDAAKDVTINQNQLREIQRGISEIETTRAKRTALETEISKTLSTSQAAEALMSDKAHEIESIQSRIQLLDQDRKAKQVEFQKIRQQERLIQSHRRLCQLFDLINQIDPIEKRIRDAKQALTGPKITSADVSRLRDLERRHDVAVELRKARFGCFTTHGDDALASVDGAEIPNGVPQTIDRKLEISLPGFGQFTLEPATDQSKDIDDPTRLAAELKTQLAEWGQPSVNDLDRALSAQTSAENLLAAATTELRAIAPDGAAALQEEYRQLAEQLDHPVTEKPKLPNATDAHSDTIEAQVATLERQIDVQRELLKTATDEHSELSSKVAEHRVILKLLRSDLDAITAAPDEIAVLDQLNEQLAVQVANLKSAEDRHEKLKREAPNLPALKTEYERAKSADANEIQEIQKLEHDLIRLNTVIETYAENAIEEKLQETAGRLERAKQRALQFEQHAKSLSLLIQHLEAARAQAQDAYFEPIRAELLPLLRQLHVNSDFQINPDNLLVDTITRNGVVDHVDRLSGGAYEQIAILTRLAFAKLFSKQGHHVPIILDDALIHTDDERISTMFNLLAQIASDQQVIVLSCRTRAFSDLGGARAYIEETI